MTWKLIVHVYIHTHTGPESVAQLVLCPKKASTQCLVCLLSVKAMINDLVNEWKGNIRLLKFVFISTLAACVWWTGSVVAKQRIKTRFRYYSLSLSLPLQVRV